MAPESTVTIFHHVERLPKPQSWELDNFCSIAFSDIKNVLLLDEIRHYKEKDGLEHEFLLVKVKHAESEYLLRVERSTPARTRRTFWQKLTQASSSIIPAFDTVRVSSSLSKLTSEMNRGPIIHVATLSLSSLNFSLNDFCFLLSLFPAFSPIYKLKEEQCYWFCGVIMTTVSNTVGVPITPEKGFKRAGKYGRFSINLSTPARQLFVDSYKIIYNLRNNPASRLLSAKFTPDIAKTLTFMISVPSDEAKRLATTTVTFIASGSSIYRRMLVDAGSSHQFSQIFLSAPIDLKASILLALDVLSIMDLFEPLPDDELLPQVQTSEPEDQFAIESKVMLKKRVEATQHLFSLLDYTHHDVSANAQRMLANFVKHDKLRPLVLDHVSPASQNDKSGGILTSIGLLKSLAQYPDTHVQLQETLPQLFPHLLQDDIRVAAMDCISSMINVSLDQFRPGVESIFKKVIESIKDDNGGKGDDCSEDEDDDEDVRGSATKFIINAAADSNFIPVILDVFPYLVDLLIDESWKIRQAAIGLLSDLLPYVEFHSVVKEAIPKVLGSFKHKNKDVNESSVRFLAKAASNSVFTSVILDSLPWIVDQLKCESWNARFSSICMLEELIPQAEYSSRIKEAVPQVIRLFEDDNWPVRLGAIDFIGKAAFDSKYEPVIRDAFPQFVDLLEDRSWIRVDTALKLLTRLTPHFMFHPLAQKIVPKAVSLLNFSDLDVIYSASKFLSNAVNNSICRALILEECSQIVGLLKNESWLVRNICIDLLSDLFHYDECRARVHWQEVVPEVVKLFQDHFLVQVRTVRLVHQLSPLSDARSAIIDSIPQIIRFYNDASEGIRAETMSLFSSLMDYPDAQPHLQTAISAAKEQNRKACNADVHSPEKELLAKAAKYGMV